MCFWKNSGNLIFHCLLELFLLDIPGNQGNKRNILLHDATTQTSKINVVSKSIVAKEGVVVWAKKRCMLGFRNLWQLHAGSSQTKSCCYVGLLIWKGERKSFENRSFRNTSEQKESNQSVEQNKSEKKLGAPIKVKVWFWNYFLFWCFYFTRGDWPWITLPNRHTRFF